MLKYVILISICALVANGKVDLPPELQKMVEELHAACLKEGGLTENDFKTFDITKKDQKMMCYMKCLFMKAKWMNSDEVLQYDFIKENIHEAVKHITLPELENCGKKTAEGGECEKSYNFYYCMNQAEPEDWILI